MHHVFGLYIDRYPPDWHVWWARLEVDIATGKSLLAGYGGLEGDARYWPPLTEYTCQFTPHTVCVNSDLGLELDKQYEVMDRPLDYQSIVQAMDRGKLIVAPDMELLPGYWLGLAVAWYGTRLLLANN